MHSLSRTTNTDIHSVATYNPTTLSTETLLDDWRIVTAWWSSKHSGANIAFSKQQLLNLAIIIVTELQARGVNFHPSLMLPTSLTLYNRALEAIAKDSPSADLAPVLSSATLPAHPLFLTAEQLSGHWSQPIMLAEDFVTLVGGVCNSEEGTSGDVDILLKKSPPAADEDLPLLFRLYRALPHELRDRLHILYDLFHGPFTPHQHLYDLWLLPSPAHTQLHLMSSETEAAASKREDRIQPMRFFQMLKPMHGRHKGELYSIDSLVDVVNSQQPSWYDIGIYVQIKFDGVHVQVHRDKDQVLILTEHGTDITSHLPSLVADLKANPFSPLVPFVLAGELESWRNDEHQPRQDTTAIITTDPVSPNEDTILFRPFDLLFFNGKDYHNEPYRDRINKLTSFPFSRFSHFKPVLSSYIHSTIPAPQSTHETETKLRHAVQLAADQPGSEGAYLKLATFTYELDGTTLNNIKFKSTASLDVEVLSVHPVEGVSAYNYLTIIRTPTGQPVPAGNTYNTSILAQPGDILTVEFVNLNQYTDPTTNSLWFNFWAPRVIRARPDKTTPDTTVTAAKLVLATHGAHKSAPLPERYRQLLPVTPTDACTHDALTEAQRKDFEHESQLIAENKKLPAAAHPHPFKSAHWTHPNGHPRCLICGDEPCIPLTGETPDEDGYGKCPGTNADSSSPSPDLPTPTDQPDSPLDAASAMSLLRLPPEDQHWHFVLQAHVRGKSVHLDLRLQTSPLLLVGWTIALPKGLSAAPTDFKHAQRLVTDEILPLVKQTLADPTTKFLAFPKDTQPIQWLSMSGAISPGGIGATATQPGYLFILDSGTVEFLAQKAYFHEYWFDKTATKLLNGRLVFRLLENRADWQKTNEGTFSWMFFHPDNDPYVLSPRAVSLPWIPPQGYSALPRAFRGLIDSPYQYWSYPSTDQRLKWRNALLLTDWQPPAHPTTDAPPTHPYKLQHQSWRGPIVIRWGPSRSEYHLLIEPLFDLVHPDDLMVSLLDPLVQTAVHIARFSHHRYEAEGPVQPNSPLNPTIGTPSTIDVIDKGTVTILKQTPTLIVLRFNSSTPTKHLPHLFGTWSLSREPGTQDALWLFTKDTP